MTHAKMRSMSSGVLEPAQRVGALPPTTRCLTLDGTPLPVVGTARIYVCGITPYDVTHLGHAATFVWADVLASILELAGAATRSCRNVTDIDNVLTAAARARGLHYDSFALEQESLFDQSMRSLRVAEPAVRPRARHFVDAVQELAQALLDNGAAYERGGTVWFRGGRVWQDVGLDKATARSLSETYGDDPDDPAKDDPFDVPVWQPSPGGVPAWPSPWGWGRPGWHAECAAMAMAVQGASVDVLVGGEDLAFPHHAYQSAMVTAASGVTPFARATLHVGTVLLDGAPMAKSTGNLVLVDDLLSTWSPAAVRLLLLNRPMGQPWEFTQQQLAQAQAQVDRLRAAAARPGAGADATARVLDTLLEGLDVRDAIATAEREGGEAAQRLVRTLRLD